MEFLTNLDVHGNQILNLTIQNLAQAPLEKAVGQIYYNTQDKRVYCWTGETWLPLDAKDASPTAASIVRTINEGGSLIKIDKIDDLENKLKADSIVRSINVGNKNIQASKIEGLEDSLNADTMVDKINAGNKTINTNKITGLDVALSNKETPQGAQEKANTALQQAKEFATSEVTRVVGGASEAYNTLKEIEDALKKNDSLDQVVNKALKEKTGKFSQDVGDGAKNTIVVKHNLKSQDVSVTLREKNAPFKVVFTDVEITDENTVTLKFAKAPKLNEYRIVIVG